ncbi:hypothetical protein [Roseomonas sp. CECT 9278]|uniref:hypothetical protein n=1 Tax=Roseomonas sp. CECT 9278 TaxID=2845823 RepID=UPI001E501210|nr:hypothetical protein [Roseomonas sp. CECT 9278]CAH0222493.1 hypothetical protein ROS9278_02446 [Roseomonas sp. CECT 9278]
MNDPGLDALVAWLVLPASLVVMAVCLVLWRARRHWVVVDGVVRTAPDPRDHGGLTEIAVTATGGTERLLRLHVPAARGRIKAGQVVRLSHPPGQPEAMQPGTPMPLLFGAVAGGLMAMLGASMLLGI